MNAQDYKKLASAKRTVYDLPLPSGAVWKVIDPPLQQFIATGRIPVGLAAQMASIAERNNSDPEATGMAMVKELGTENLLKNLEFGRDLLLHSVIEPRISNASPTPEDAIAPEDILPEDFEFVLGWALSGGKSGAGLKFFRTKRSKSAMDRTGKQGHGGKSVESSES